MITIKKLIFIYLASFFMSTFLLSTATSAKNMDPKCEATFNFVVMGDNRPPKRTGDHVQPAVFSRIINEVNLIDPDFSMLLGDLIFGYSKNPYVIRKMWNEFDKAISKFTSPYYLIIGNHDVSNTEMENDYLERYGLEFPLYYSFNNKKSHFIVLNSDIQGEVGFITGDQLKWLKKDLVKNKNARHTFVFMHRPLSETIEPTNWMEEIHPLMVKYKIDTVFAGHWHIYQKAKTRDNVRYIITGGAGAPIGSSTINGSFFHYLLVTVRGNDVSIAVIRPDNIDNEEIVNQTTVDNAHETVADLTTIYLPKDMDNLPSILNLIVTNRFNVPINGIVSFTKNKNSPWIIPTNTIISVSPGATQKIPLEITKPVTSKTLGALNPVPRIFWELTVGNFTFNVASNRRSRIIIDDWPHSKDVELLAKGSLSIKPIIAKNRMTGKIIVTAKNPISDGPITIKTKWILPTKSNWKLSARRTKSYNLKPGEEMRAQISFSFDGKRKELFPLPHLKIKVFMEDGLAWQQTRRLPILAEEIFRGKTVNSQAYKTKFSPEIDGILDDPGWKKCKLISGFVLEHANGLAYNPTKARLAYDNKNLYIALRCNDDDLENLRTNTIKNDGGVYNDDSIELFIDTNLDKSTYFQYVINAAGLIYDGRNKDKSWSGPISSKVGREKEAWTVEIAIPWKTLEMEIPIRGSKIGLNISRNKMHKPIEHSQWSPTFGDNHTPALFGIVEFE